MTAERGDRPYLRQERDTFVRDVALAVVAVAVVAGIAWYFAFRREAPPPRPAPVPAATPAAPRAPPAVRHELPAPEAAESLPSLDNSDTLLRHLLAGLLGRDLFDALVYPSGLVRRIVVMVDNLPQRTLPRSKLPLNAVPGGFKVSGAGDALAIDPANAARYAPYVRAIEAVDIGVLVGAYIRAYPLFQQAYRELGYPDKYFNDRLLEAIDDLLAAPEPDGPVRLLQPKVLYQYADSELEARSAGQRIMVRMGLDNERRAKARLKALRAAIVAASRPATEGGKGDGKKKAP